MDNNPLFNPANFQAFANFMAQQPNAQQQQDAQNPPAGNQAPINPQIVQVGQAQQNHTLWGMNLRVNNYYNVANAIINGVQGGDAAGATQMPEDVLNLFKNMEITDEIQGRLELIAVVVAYAGFDPKVIRGVLWSRFITGHPNPNSAQAKQDFRIEMLTLIVLFLQRGNSIIKIINKSSQEAVGLITALRAKYDLQASAGQSASRATLTRVSQSFPEATMEVLIRMPNLRVLGRTDFLPRPLMFGGSCAMLPNNLWFILYCAWAKSQDLIINSRRPSPAAQGGGPAQPDTRTKFWQYALLSYESTIFNAEEREVLVTTAVHGVVVNGVIEVPDEAVLEWTTNERLQSAINYLGQDYIDLPDEIKL